MQDPPGLARLQQALLLERAQQFADIERIAVGMILQVTEESRLVASLFVSDGTIVTTRGRAQPTETLTASGDAISTKIPVVVLVDHNLSGQAKDAWIAGDADEVVAN